MGGNQSPPETTSPAQDFFGSPHPNAILPQPIIPDQTAGVPSPDIGAAPPQQQGFIKIEVVAHGRFNLPIAGFDAEVRNLLGVSSLKADDKGLASQDGYLSAGDVTITVTTPKGKQARKVIPGGAIPLVGTFRANLEVDTDEGSLLAGISLFFSDLANNLVLLAIFIVIIIIIAVILFFVYKALVGAAPFAIPAAPLPG